MDSKSCQANLQSFLATSVHHLGSNIASIWNPRYEYQFACFSSVRSLNVNINYSISAIVSRKSFKKVVISLSYFSDSVYDNVGLFVIDLVGNVFASFVASCLKFETIERYCNFFVAGYSGRLSDTYKYR